MTTRVYKRKTGRPSKGRVPAGYTIDKEARAFIDSLGDNNRADFVNALIVQCPQFKKSPYYEEWKRNRRNGEYAGV